MKESTKEKIRKIEEFLFGSRACICCGKENDGDNEYRLCVDCMKNIPFVKENYCLRCGEIIKGDYDYCVRCKDRSFEFDYSRSVFAYTDLTAPIIMNFKYNGLRSHVYPLARLLRDFFSTSDLIADSVTFVPMPPKRKKERGYNQSYELAKEFCKLTGLELLSVLERTKENVKQATLTAKERSENIKNSFRVTDKSKIKDREILIIDDVMTTGATANECAKVLMKAGARNVQVLTLAKTIAGGIDNLIEDK
ncbi:MAG: ComF family protein [Clostridia bacterium]|nr:ComF family protein [Clostridia bacterium]